MSGKRARLASVVINERFETRRPVQRVAERGHLRFCFYFIYL